MPVFDLWLCRKALHAFSKCLHSEIHQFCWFFRALLNTNPFAYMSTQSFPYALLRYQNRCKTLQNHPQLSTNTANFSPFNHLSYAERTCFPTTLVVVYDIPPHIPLVGPVGKAANSVMARVASTKPAQLEGLSWVALPMGFLIGKSHGISGDLLFLVPKIGLRIPSIHRFFPFRCWELRQTLEGKLGGFSSGCH